MCALPPVVFCLGQGELMLPLVAAIVLHEFGHLLAVRVFGGKMRGFGPAPFGLCINYDESRMSLLGEAAVAAAGCVINLAMVIASFALYKVLGIDLIDFGIVNAALFLLNILPIRPLDGGNLLSVTVEMLFGINAAYIVTAVVTYAFGAVIFFFSSYLLLTSVSGIYPLLFSIYIFVYNAKTIEKAVFGEKESI